MTQHRFKQLVPLIALSLGALFVQSADAQTVLVAGWDFNGTITDIKNVSANYADDFTGANGTSNTALDGSSANSRGSFRMDGNFGSELIAAGPNGSAVSSSGNTTDKYITTRTFGSIGDSLGYIPGTEQAAGIQVKNTTSPQTFAFSLNSTGIQGLSLSVDIARSAASNLTIDWGYTTSGSGFTSLGVTTAVTTGAGTYGTYTIDFSAISALNNLAQVSLLGQANSTSATNVQLRIDNVAVYGTVSAIPEPSTYALIVGVSTLGLAALRRRRSGEKVVRAASLE